MKRIFTGILISSLVLTAVIVGSSTITKSVDLAEHGRTLTLLKNL
jgi:hypothetical protein